MDPDAFQNELEKNFHISIIEPFDAGRTGILYSSANPSQITKMKMMTSDVIGIPHSEQTGDIGNKKDYRPEFCTLIEEFRKSAGSRFKGRKTRNKKNFIVNCNELPREIRPYFCDFPQERRFSIELDLNITRYPEMISTIERISKIHFKRLPSSNSLNEQKTEDGSWLRLQFFYKDDTPPSTVVQGMFDLIDQSIQEIMGTPEI
jgi:hypothetical protein